MKNKTSRQIVMAGLLAAMVFVATKMITVPLPAVGYGHLGDTMVYLSGIILGPVLGGISAGIGSFLADLFSPYAVYAIPTLIIKFADAFIVGYFYHKSKSADSMAKKTSLYSIGVILGGAVMVFGYFAFEAVTAGVGVAVGGMLFNTMQAFVGGVIGYFILIGLEKANFFRVVKSH